VLGRSFPGRSRPLASPDREGFSAHVLSSGNRHSPGESVGHHSSDERFRRVVEGAKALGPLEIAQSTQAISCTVRVTVGFGFQPGKKAGPRQRNPLRGRHWADSNGRPTQGSGVRGRREYLRLELKHARPCIRGSRLLGRYPRESSLTVSLSSAAPMPPRVHRTPRYVLSPVEPTPLPNLRGANGKQSWWDQAERERRN
jgi:hypothetical protein